MLYWTKIIKTKFCPKDTEAIRENIQMLVMQDRIKGAAIPWLKQIREGNYLSHIVGEWEKSSWRRWLDLNFRDNDELKEWAAKDTIGIRRWIIFGEPQEFSLGCGIWDEAYLCGGKWSKARIKSEVCSQAALSVQAQDLALGSSTSMVFTYESDNIGFSAAGGGLVLRGWRMRQAVR